MFEKGPLKHSRYHIHKQKVNKSPNYFDIEPQKRNHSRRRKSIRVLTEWLIQIDRWTYHIKTKPPALAIASTA